MNYGDEDYQDLLGELYLYVNWRQMTNWMDEPFEGVDRWWRG